jgi:hypothetical protein
MVDLVAPWQPDAAATLALELLIDCDALARLNPFAPTYARRRACLCFERCNAVCIGRWYARLERR